MSSLSYSSEQRTKALLVLAETHGDVDAVADLLIDDEFQVPADTLRYWMLDAHAEQYRRLAGEHGRRLEAETISQLRETIRKTSTVKHELIDKVKELAVSNPRESPHALRAITDAEAKSTVQLLQLTGRPVNGAQEGGSDAMLKLAKHMIDQGLLRPADGITLDPADVEEVPQ